MGIFCPQIHPNEWRALDAHSLKSKLSTSTQ
jgi:hypothetical protein